MNLNFWQRVDFLLVKNGISRKELALSVGFDVSNIGKGILNNNVPAADTAVKIALYLNTTAEYLVTGKDSNNKTLASEDIDIYNKYSHTLHCLDNIPSQHRTPIQNLIEETSISYRTNTEES